MFGHQDSTNHDAAVQPATPTIDGIVSHPISPQTVAPTATSPDLSSEQADNSDYILNDLTATQPAATGLGALSAPASIPAAAPTVPADAPAVGAATPAIAAPAVDSGLLELKQAALHELTPLLDHLEQTAEEKFRTMMMMIQASDDQSLLAEAYQAAQGIEDKKARAQALLDVVNEINYFTQQHSDANAQS